jgi:Uncharacterized conserved protein containing a coiled-coil domain
VSLEEEIKKVLLNNPSILVDILTAKPEIIYQVLSKLTPWQNLATKQDIEELKRDLATKEDVKRVRQDLDDIRKVMATKDDLKSLATKQDLDDIRKVMATKDDLKSLATKQDLDDIRKVMATKDDLKSLATKQDLDDIRKVMATKDDIRRLDITITGLGARWGIMNEDAFREGVRELLKDAGWKVSREVLYDKEGYVYGEPSDVEYDVVIRDGVVTLIEITSSLKRGDLPVIRKKRELYEKVKNVKVNLVYLITPFIHDRYPERVKAMARDMQIEVVYPTP